MEVITMSRKEMISINIGKLYVEMDKLFMEAANEKYDFQEGDENAFFRMYIPIIKAVKNIIDSNPDKTIFYFKSYGDVVYINKDEYNGRDYPLHQIRETDAKDIINSDNSVDLLAEDNRDMMNNECMQTSGFLVHNIKDFDDVFNYINVAIYNTVVKFFGEYFNDYKTIRGEIIGFMFIMDCTGKRKFRSDDIKFCFRI